MGRRGMLRYDFHNPASDETERLRFSRCSLISTMSSRARNLMHPLLFRSTSDLCQLSMLPFGRHQLSRHRSYSKNMT